MCFSIYLKNQEKCRKNRINLHLQIFPQGFGYSTNLNHSCRWSYNIRNILTAPTFAVTNVLSKHVVILEKCGPVDVYVEGDLEKLRDSENIFLTVHDIGSSYLSWKKFTANPDMADVRTRWDDDY